MLKLIRIIFDDMINLKNLEPNKIKPDEKSYKIYFFTILATRPQIV